MGGPSQAYNTDRKLNYIGFCHIQNSIKKK